MSWGHYLGSTGGQRGWPQWNIKIGHIIKPNQEKEWKNLTKVWGFIATCFVQIWGKVTGAKDIQRAVFSDSISWLCGQEKRGETNTRCPRRRCGCGQGMMIYHEGSGDWGQDLWLKKWRNIWRKLFARAFSHFATTFFSFLLSS